MHVRSRVIAALIGAALVGTLSAVPASAQTPVCPAPNQRDFFSNDNGSVHEPNINCARAYDLTRYSLSPDVRLSRLYVAVYLVDYIEGTTGLTLPQSTVHPFTDTADADIEKAHEARVLRGFPNGTFRGGQLVTRAQFATAMVQATNYISGQSLRADADDAFDDDDGSVHEANIEAARDNGLLEGTRPREFGILLDVTSGQAISIIMRAVQNVLAPAGIFP